MAEYEELDAVEREAEKALLRSDLQLEVIKERLKMLEMLRALRENAQILAEDVVYYRQQFEETKEALRHPKTLELEDLQFYIEELETNVTEFLSTLEQLVVINKQIEELTKQPSYNIRVVKAKPVLEKILRENKEALLSFTQNENQAQRLTAIRILGDFVDTVDDPDMVSVLLHQVLQSEGEVRQIAQEALSKSPFLQTHFVKKEDGPLCVCSKCYHRFKSRIISIGGRQVECWVCRICGSMSRLEKIQKIVALLDHSDKITSMRSGVLIVNWLKYHTLFDFDEVRIEDADDFEVEEFTIKARNDTDATRRNRQRTIPVYLSPNLGLTLAKINLLKDTFGKVQVRAG
jgi:hypothetical protein